MVSVGDFKRLDLRVGQVVEAEAILGAPRLLKVTVDLGGELRALVGGLAERYAPAGLRGLQVIVIANLEPAAIRGVRSEGMMLGVGCGQPGAVSLLTGQRPVANGAPVL